MCVSVCAWMHVVWTAGIEDRVYVCANAHVSVFVCV